MLISKQYVSPVAQQLIHTNSLARQAFDEVASSITNNVSPGQSIFILNNSQKNCNGVVPIKEHCYQILEESYGWFRERPLYYFHNDAKKGGPIDVYKDFIDGTNVVHAGLEFETGNISSAHRSMNKLCVGIKKHELDIAFLMMPVFKTAYYLTDRISNYEELAPYLEPLLDDYPFVVFGFSAEAFDPSAPLLSKGKDGMSPRSIHRWKNH